MAMTAPSGNYGYPFGLPSSPFVANFQYQDPTMNASFVPPDPNIPSTSFFPVEPHGLKRHLDVTSESALEDGAPLPKRKIAKINAQLRNFHITPVKKTTIWNERNETFQEIEDRLSDSSDEEMKEEGTVESDEENKPRLKLSDELQNYIKRAREHTVIISGPETSKALVPYVPRNPFEDPSMKGRIQEITDDEAKWIMANQPVERPAIISYIDEAPSDGSDNLDTSSSGSSPLSIVELPEDVDNPEGMDIDY